MDSISLTFPEGFSDCDRVKLMVKLYVQSTPDNSNLQIIRSLSYLGKHFVENGLKENENYFEKVEGSS